MVVKTKRGYPDGNKDYFLKNDAISEFFKVNKLTIDKFKYLNSIIPKAKINILIVKNYPQKFSTHILIILVKKAFTTHQKAIVKIF
jgi:hypothetical protein